MKKNALIFTCSGLLIAGSFLSCDNGNTPSDTELPFTLTIDGTEQDAASSYNFGLTEAEGTGISKTIILTNSTGSDVTVNSLTLSDEVNYSLTSPALPVTTAAGGTAEVTLTFSPQSSGSIDSTISIEVQGISDPFILDLSGEGNYAPTVKFGIQVTGAGNTAANGFYERDGFFNTDPNYRRPNYTKSGSINFYCYLYDYSDGWFWGIDSTQGLGYPDNTEYASDDWNEYMVPPETGWVDNTIEDTPPGLTLYDITGTNAQEDEELTANYLYFDEEGDAEVTADASYQWYRSNAEDGTYTAISGATTETYIPAADSGFFLKVEITPSAATGITSGKAVMSSATIEITSPPPS